MPSILGSLGDLLGEGEGYEHLARIIDGDAVTAQAAVDAVGPALVGGLAEQAGALDGREIVSGLLDEADPTLVDDVDGYLRAGGDAPAGNGFLDSLFGDERDGLTMAVAAGTDLDLGGVDQILQRVAPLFMAVVARRRDDGLDVDGVASLVGEERADLESQGRLGPWFASLLAGGAAVAAVSGSEVSGSEVSGSEVSGSEVSGSESGAVAGVGAESATGENDLLAMAGDGAGVEGGTTAAVGAAVGAAGAAAGAAATGNGTGGGSGTDGTAPGTKDRPEAAAGRTAGTVGATAASPFRLPVARRSGLGWLWWATGCLLAVLVVAWLVGQIPGDDVATTAADDRSATTSVAGDDGDDGDTDGAAAGDTADGDSVEAGDTAEGAEMQAAVDAALRAAVSGGVTATVDGDVVTLTGTVDTEASQRAATAAVMVVDGVGSIDDQVVVESATDGASAGTAADGAAAPTLNERLGLEPITFRYLSAQVTPSGAAQLDRAVAHLAGNDLAVQIQGHTDDDGDEARNLILSQRRADAVKEYLVAAGIDAGRLSTVGFGEREPLVPNDSLVNKALNRRIELVVVDG